jgi:glycosyltransferase involved in cell wall biosynthesis
MTLIGEGPLRGYLEGQFRVQGVIDQCEFLGSVPRHNVARRLRESGVFLLPTRIEGFGLTIVEAMLSGTVPVVSKLRGITDDIIDDNVTGMLIEPDDVKGFAKAIVHLLKNPKILRSMSDAARAVATERYSVGRMLDDYESLFAEADDREHMAHANTFRWIKETFVEVMKHGVDRKWFFNRAKEIWKQS